MANLLQSGTFRGQTIRSLVAPVPLHIDSLPLHENLASASHALARPTLQAFLETVLREGMDFVHETVPKMPHYKTVTLKKRGPSRTEVLLSKANLEVQRQPFPTSLSRGGQPPPRGQAKVPKFQEYWIARKSIHPNVPLAGTASWDEFCIWAHAQYILNAKLFINHICNVAQVGNYDCKDVDVAGFSQISARICLVIHRFGPRVISTRKVFPVLIVSAIRSASFSPGFIQVQLPLHPDAIHTGWQRYVPRGAPVGQHTSIQYLKLAPVAQGRPPYKDYQNATTEVHWTFAIAADSESRLPSFLRVADSPHIMAEEVSWFLKWAQWRRKVPVPCQNLVSLAPCNIVPNYRYCTIRHRPTETITPVAGLEGAVTGLVNFVDNFERRVVRHSNSRTSAAAPSVAEQGEMRPSDPRLARAMNTARIYNLNVSGQSARRQAVEELTRQETTSGVLTWDSTSQGAGRPVDALSRWSVTFTEEEYAAAMLAAVTAAAEDIAQGRGRRRRRQAASPWSSQTGPSGLPPSARLPTRTPPSTPSNSQPPAPEAEA